MKPLNQSVFFLVAVFLFGSNPVAAQLNISQKHEHVIKSKMLARTYYVFVSLPTKYSTTDTTRYPVVYLLDGNVTFPMAHAARTMLDVSGEIENVIIVGLGYEWDKSLQPSAIARWHDYTPSRDAAMDSNPGMLKFLDLPKGALESGGAEKFAGVLKNEVMPLINKQYRTNGDNGIVGHSFGGLFAANSLFSSDRLFSRFGLLSPSLHWNGNEMLTVEKSFGANNSKLPFRVFLSIGRDEGDTFVANIQTLASSMEGRHYEGLQLTTLIFEKETHMSVIPVSISRVLRVLYPPIR